MASTQSGPGVAPKIKASTHAVAALLSAWIIAAGTFVSTNAGHALVAQYPKLAAAAAVVTAAAGAVAAYRSPR